MKQYDANYTVWCKRIRMTQGKFYLLFPIKYSGTPLILSRMGQKNLAVLMGWPNKRGFFLQENVWQYLPGGQKKTVTWQRGDHITEMAVRRSSTVYHYLRFMAFQKCCFVVSKIVNSPINLHEFTMSLVIIIRIVAAIKIWFMFNLSKWFSIL